MTMREPRRHEDGAVAIMVAILAVALLTVAALSVDLGNAWARKRDLQTQADLAALSAGHLLPQTVSNRTAILTEVATYLNKPNNNVQDQPDATAAQLDDDNLANGEVDFFGSGTRMRVIAPAATVDFFLAEVVGFHDTDVNAQATVELQSLQPNMVEVLPFGLPSGCPYGPGMADTGSGPAPSPSPSPSPTAPAPDFSPTSGESASHTVTNTSPVSTNKNTTPTITVNVGNLPNNSTGGTVRFRFGATTFVDYPVTWSSTSNSSKTRSPTVTLTTNVTGTAGVWKVWLIAGNANKYSATSADFTVIDPASSSPSPSPTPSPVGCSVSVSGNYGQLDSPRTGVGQRPTRFAYNIALGLDHQVVPFPSATANVCAGNSGNNPIAGANLDEAPSTDGRNCLNIDPGNDGPNVMEGLITGVNNTTVKGRLDNSFTAASRPSGCPGPTTVNGKSINNETLSCYLKAGATKAQLILPSGPASIFENLLDPRITASPRFVWIPVLRTPERINDKWQPIKMFVPAFITGETVTGAGNSDNGVAIGSNGNSVRSVQVFTFNPLALPINERDPSTVYDPGGRSIVRLVD